MRSPRIDLKIKGPLKSQVRRIVAEIRLGRDAVLQAEAAVPGLGPAQPPARAPAPAQAQAVAPARPLHPAAQEAPARPGAPVLAAPPAPQALLGAGMTTGGAPAPSEFRMASLLITVVTRKVVWADKMAQQVKVFAAKLNSLGLIPGTHMVACDNSRGLSFNLQCAQ